VRRKLIEVALPLEAINAASAREKSIRHGHPSTLHLWWARRPLAAARAVIFAQMVDDPSSCPDLFPTEKAQEKERQRLHTIIKELVTWENTTNEDALPSCSTATGSPASTTLSRVEAPCRSKLSAWVSKLTRATSTPWRCSSTRR
jgi:adenine-specific DNA methylase